MFIENQFQTINLNQKVMFGKTFTILCPFSIFNSWKKSLPVAKIDKGLTITWTSTVNC